MSNREKGDYGVGGSRGRRYIPLHKQSQYDSRYNKGPVVGQPGNRRSQERPEFSFFQKRRGFPEIREIGNSKAIKYSVAQQEKLSAKKEELEQKIVDIASEIEQLKQSSEDIKDKVLLKEEKKLQEAQNQLIELNREIERNNAIRAEQVTVKFGRAVEDYKNAVVHMCYATKDKKSLAKAEVKAAIDNIKECIGELEDSIASLDAIKTQIKAIDDQIKKLSDQEKPNESQLALLRGKRKSLENLQLFLNGKAGEKQRKIWEKSIAEEGVNSQYLKSVHEESDSNLGTVILGIDGSVDFCIQELKSIDLMLAAEEGLTMFHHQNKKFISKLEEWREKFRSIPIISFLVTIVLSAIQSYYYKKGEVVTQIKEETHRVLSRMLGVPEDEINELILERKAFELVKAEEKVKVQNEETRKEIEQKFRELANNPALEIKKLEASLTAMDLLNEIGDSKIVLIILGSPKVDMILDILRTSPQLWKGKDSIIKKPIFQEICREETLIEMIKDPRFDDILKIIENRRLLLKQFKSYPELWQSKDSPIYQPYFKDILSLKDYDRVIEAFGSHPELWQSKDFPMLQLYFKDILASDNAVVVIRALIKNPELWQSKDSLVHQPIFKDILASGSANGAILYQLGRYPELWQSKDSLINQPYLNDILASQDPSGVLEVLGQYPMLWQSKDSLINQPYLNDILASQDPSGVLEVLGQYPMLWKSNDSFMYQPILKVILKSNTSKTVLNLLMEYPHLQVLLDKSIFLDILNQSFPFTGNILSALAVSKNLFQNTIENKISIQILKIQAPVVNEMIAIIQGTKNKFTLNEDDIETAIKMCSNENIPKMIDSGNQINRRIFVKNIILKILEKKEKDILEEIPIKILEDRKLLFGYLKSQEPRHYVLEKLTSQAEVWLEMGKHQKMKHFKFEEIWRFVMDGNHEDKGAYYFEDEPGYMVASLKALLNALQEKDQPSFNWYRNLHDKVVDEVFRFNKQYGYESFPKNIHFNIKFGLEPPHFSINNQYNDYDEIGIEDLIVRGTRSEKKPFQYNEESMIIQNLFDLHGLDIVNVIFDKFNIYISNEQNPIMRLMAYAWLAREMELRHIFSDANGRTSILAIYSLVARDPELPMILFHNPNMLDGNGPEKILYRLIEDMENFKNNGLWKKEGHQLTHDPMVLDDLVCPDFEEYIEMGKERVQGKKWAYFHELIMGEGF